MVCQSARFQQGLDPYSGHPRTSPPPHVSAQAQQEHSSADEQWGSANSQGFLRDDNSLIKGRSGTSNSTCVSSGPGWPSTMAGSARARPARTRPHRGLQDLDLDHPQRPHRQTPGAAPRCKEQLINRRLLLRTHHELGLPERADQTAAVRRETCPASTVTHCPGSARSTPQQPNSPERPEDQPDPLTRLWDRDPGRPHRHPSQLELPRTHRRRCRMQIGSAFWLRDPDVGKLHNDRVHPAAPRPHRPCSTTGPATIAPVDLRSNRLLLEQRTAHHQTPRRATPSPASPASATSPHTNSVDTLATCNAASDRGIEPPKPSPPYSVHINLSHDHGLRPHRRQDRRRRVLRRHRTKSKPSTTNPTNSPPATKALEMAQTPRPDATNACSATATAPDPVEIDCHFESICESWATFLRHRPSSS